MLPFDRKLGLTFCSVWKVKERPPRFQTRLKSGIKLIYLIYEDLFKGTGSIIPHQGNPLVIKILLEENKWFQNQNIAVQEKSG